MPAPRMFSTTGSALSSDEIAFAQQVAASFSLNMKHGWIKIIRRIDSLTGAIVEYHADKDIAYVTPGGAVDYVQMVMPNPVPYRGVSIGAVSVGGAVTTKVMTSDGVVLASEAQTTSGGHTYYVPDTAWNGEGYVNMYVDSIGGVFDHQLTFTAPEDCIYPVPSVASSVFNLRQKNWLKKNSGEFIAALKTGFSVGTSGVNRAELQLVQLPASWDYQIKAAVGSMYSTYSTDTTVGQHTKMPIIMSITSAPDVVVSDTSANLTQSGTKVTRRTTTFTYTDTTGAVWSVPIDGMLTQAVTKHAAVQISTGMVSVASAISVVGSYLNWFSPSTAPEGPDTLLWHSFLRDRSPFGLGVLWNGNTTTFPAVNGNSATGETITVHPTRRADSKWGVPSNLLSSTSEELAGVTFSTPLPWYSNTLVGTAPDIFLQYHNTVKPVYVSDAAQASTVMNNSAMYGVTKVELTPVGLIANGVGTAAAGESVGIFNTVEDGTQVEIYGTAVYSFNWQTGSLTFTSWKPLHGANGLEVSSKTINLPQGIVWSDIGVNCLVTYRGLHWPDIIKAVNTRNNGLSTSVTPEGRTLYALVNAAKSG